MSTMMFDTGATNIWTEQRDEDFGNGGHFRRDCLISMETVLALVSSLSTETIPIALLQLGS